MMRRFTLDRRGRWTEHAPNAPTGISPETFRRWALRDPNWRTDVDTPGFSVFRFVGGSRLTKDGVTDLEVFIDVELLQ